MKIAFAGLRHEHIFALYRLASEDPDVEISGAWEENPAAAAEAKQIIAEPFYPSYDALLSDTAVDIVAIGDYYGIRGERILRALAAGKHVLSDKPLCTTEGELEMIGEAAAAGGLRIGCMLDLRYDPALCLAQKRIRDGELGEIRSLSFTGQHPLNYGKRPGWYFEAGKHGGTINDLAVHGIDAVRRITGLEYRGTLCARQWNSFALREPGFADSAQILGEWENGAGMLADVSYSAPAPAAFSLPSYWRFTFWGETGFLECRLGEGGVTSALRGEASPRFYPAPPVTGNCLSELMEEIRGERANGTPELLASSRTVLQIQAAADRAAMERVALS